MPRSRRRVFRPDIPSRTQLRHRNILRVRQNANTIRQYYRTRSSSYNIGRRQFAYDLYRHCLHTFNITPNYVNSARAYIVHLANQDVLYPDIAERYLRVLSSRFPHW